MNESKLCLVRLLAQLVKEKRKKKGEFSKLDFPGNQVTVQECHNSDHGEREGALQADVLQVRSEGIKFREQLRVT